MKRAMEIAEQAELLPEGERIWLIERLARSLKRESVLTSPRIIGDLSAMGQDPQIQREIAAIADEFAGTELDGLKPANVS